jgi:hypothetical protein
MSKIRITSTPPGFAPEEIRKQWIGIEIPIMGIEDPKTAGNLRTGTENLGGYEVSPKEAVEALKKAGKHEAVKFWTPYISAPKFVFKKEVCEVIE